MFVTYLSNNEQDFLQVFKTCPFKNGINFIGSNDMF